MHGAPNVTFHYAFNRRIPRHFAADVRKFTNRGAPATSVHGPATSGRPIFSCHTKMKATPQQNTAMPRQRFLNARGFTLVEVMITVAIIAILAAVALPQYSAYVTRSRLADASTGLATMRAQMERYYQDNRTYDSVGTFVSPCKNSNVASRTFGNFEIGCTAADGTKFTLEAVGNGPVNGFKYTINQQDQRATTAIPPSFGSTCTSKWIMKKGESC